MKNAAIEAVRGNDMAAWRGQVEREKVDSRHTGGRCEARLAPLKRGQTALKDVHARIIDARINETPLFTGKQSPPAFERTKREGDGSIESWAHTALLLGAPAMYLKR